MSGKTLITGGAGFVGTNLADRLLRAGERVTILDDLSRAGVRDNLAWLRAMHGNRLEIFTGDIRDGYIVRRATQGVSRVFHFAAQVAVTTSLDDPMQDFSVNLLGTVTLLEALRALPNRTPVLFTSTNKVYGTLDDVRIISLDGRYEPEDAGLRANGIGEERPLQFCSPYGCSKGGADQYVLDYAKSFDLDAVVFRMSCIYGPHQCGNEDQGWVAHFVKQAMARAPITLYGDGRQVRDVLYVDDLLDAMLLATDNIERTRGQVFNMGGGPQNTISLRELLGLIGELEGATTPVALGPWRVGDQRWYVSDTRAFTRATGWKARVSVRSGVERLHAWLREHRAALEVAGAR